MERRADGAIVVTGHALHSGAPCVVTMRRTRDASIIFGRGARTCAIEDLRAVATDHATTIGTRDGALRFATIEHLFAAFGAMGVRKNVKVDIDAEELPILDGGARIWCDVIASLDVPHTLPKLRVMKDETIAIGASRYAFSIARELSVDVAVQIDFDDARIDRDARWLGDAIDFRERIASARTFAFARDFNEITVRGLASRSPRESVVAITRDQIHSAGAAFTRDEPARHKLMDLIGDLFLYGGPPIGHIHAERPGHAMTHQIVQIALERHILERIRDT
jgi:UDP-3-O-[3-hydroxymyristoyl] N-acetylglucosamine deacetylase